MSWPDRLPVSSAQPRDSLAGEVTRSRHMSQCQWITVTGAFILATVLLSEYLIYYLTLLPCSWPTLGSEGELDSQAADSVHIMLLADPHLVGVYRGHPLDRVRRDWQMRRAFQAAITLHSPEVVLILGDILDEGLWASPEDYEVQVQRYHSIFDTHNRSIVKNIVGNHDIGFHYAVHYVLDKRFRENFAGGAQTGVRLWRYKGFDFVFANSMAFEGDNCDFCYPAEVNLRSIAHHLECLHLRSSNHLQQPCDVLLATEKPPLYADPDSEALSVSSQKAKSRPILVQHFPLFRENELSCPSTPRDAMPAEKRGTAYRPKWDCLSRLATSKLLRLLQPRLVLSGHSHYSCTLQHQVAAGNGSLEVTEYTMASFSWRNLPHPSFLLLTLSAERQAVAKCYLPTEVQIVVCYLLGLISLTVYQLRRCLRRRLRACCCLLWTGLGCPRN